MSNSIESLLLDASSFIQSEFNLQLRKSQLKPYSPDNWQEFCQVNNFDVNSEGLYVPASYSAYVRTDSPVLVSNVFHELYGHGLFVEHSKIGKNLTEIIRNTGDGKSFMFDEVNPQEQPFGLAKYNIHNYEGFAVWLEALLCQETGNSKVWNLKKDGLQEDYAQLFEFFEDAESQLSKFGFMSQLGFPKFYDNNKILDVVKRVYSSAFENIDFIVLYGSQKPESDIDLFIVSNNPSTNYFNGWLDISELNRGEFQNRLEHLDIALTDAMFSGKLIYGDYNLFQKERQKIIDTKITRKIINYNHRKAKKQKSFLKSFQENERLKNLSLSYIESFSQNAEQLSLGNKPLTLKNLKKFTKIEFFVPFYIYTINIICTLDFNI